jgi:HK97 family phage major capsid protein
MATVEEIEARLSEIRARIQEIDSDFAGQALPDEQKAEWETLEAEREDQEALRDEFMTRRERVAELAENPKAREPGFQVPKPRTKGQDIYDLSTIRSSVNGPEEATRELRDRAKTSVEQSSFMGNQEDAQGHVERLLEHDGEDARLSMHLLSCGGPTYKRAFGKYLADASRTAEEQRVLDIAQRTALTAQGAGGAGGGFAVPYTLDPSVLPTDNWSVNPYRAISRVIPITTTTWRGVSSAGVVSSYAGEAADATDNAPTLAQPEITPARAQCFVPYSREIGEDWGSLVSEVSRMIADSKDDLEADKFTFGTSTSSSPEGILVGGTAFISTATAATLAAADLYSLETALPPRFRKRAQFIANRATYNRVRAIDTAGGAQLWTENLQRGLENNVPTPGNTGYNLLGYGANEVSTYPQGTATTTKLVTFGDFSYYAIVERVGMSVEVIPHLFGTADNKPTGQRGLYAYWRNSAEVLASNAFRNLRAL